MLQIIKKFTNYGYKMDVEKQLVYGFLGTNSTLNKIGYGPLMYAKVSDYIGTDTTNKRCVLLFRANSVQMVENADEVMKARNADMRALLDKNGHVVQEDGYLYGYARKIIKHKVHKVPEAGMISVRAKLDDVNYVENGVIYTCRYEKDPTILQRLKDVQRFHIDAEGRIYGHVSQKDIWDRKPFIETDVFEREKSAELDDATKLWIRAKPDALVFFDHGVARFSFFEVVGNLLNLSTVEDKKSALYSFGHKVVGEYAYGFYTCGTFNKWSPSEKGGLLGRAKITDIVKVNPKNLKASKYTLSNISNVFDYIEVDNILAFVRNDLEPIVILHERPCEEYKVPIKVSRRRILRDVDNYICLREDMEILETIPNEEALKENGFAVDKNGWVTGFVSAPIHDLTIVHALPPDEHTTRVRILAHNAKLTGDKGRFIASMSQLEVISKKQIAIERGFRVNGDWVYGYYTCRTICSSTPYSIFPNGSGNARLVRFLADNMIIPYDAYYRVFCYDDDCEFLTRVETLQEYGFEIKDNMVYGYWCPTEAYCYRAPKEDDNTIYRVHVDKIKNFDSKGFTCHPDDLTEVVEDSAESKIKSFLKLNWNNDYFKDGFVHGWMKTADAQKEGNLYIGKVPTGCQAENVCVKVPIEKVDNIYEWEFICDKADVVSLGVEASDVEDHDFYARFYKVIDGFVFGWLNKKLSEEEECEEVFLEKYPCGKSEDNVYVKVPITNVDFVDERLFSCKESDVIIVESPLDINKPLKQFVDDLGCIDVGDYLQRHHIREEFILFGHHVAGDYVYSLYPADKLPADGVIPDNPSADETTWFSQYANPSPDTIYAQKYESGHSDVLCILRHSLNDAFPIGDKIKFRAFEIVKRDRNDIFLTPRSSNPSFFMA